MTGLSCDLETYSSADLKKCGVHRYVEKPDFEVLLFSFAVNDGPVRLIDLASGELLPAEIRAAILDPNVIKWAWNASSNACACRAIWRCTMVWAATLGLPLSLEQAGAGWGWNSRS